MMEALQYDFIQRALMAGFLVSIACGIVGTYVVLNRIVFMSAGIAHAAYGGIGLGLFCGFNPLWSALGFSTLSAAAMGAVKTKTTERSDTLIGVLWSMGMATGILLIDLSEGYKSDLMGYLFGSILAVANTDLLFMTVVVLALILCAVLYTKELLAVSFDSEYAAVQQVPSKRIYILSLCMVAITVVMMMRMVGLILVIALLTIPASISGMFVKRVGAMVVLAALLSMLFTVIGLMLSYNFDVSSGASIILTAGVSFLFCIVGRSLFRK